MAIVASKCPHCGARITYDEKSKLVIIIMFTSAINDFKVACEKLLKDPAYQDRLSEAFTYQSKSDTGNNKDNILIQKLITAI